MEKNTELEPLVIPRDEDEDAPCTIFARSKIAKCPLHEACSPQAWKSAPCWSSISPESALKYLRHHLVVSERHDMTEDEAYSIDVDNLHEETLPKKVKEYLAREYSPAKFESQGSMGDDGLAQNRQRPNCCKRRRVAP